MENLISLIKIWAADRGLLKKEIVHQQLSKLMEESGELAGAVIRNDQLKIRDSIGDIQVVLIILSEQLGLDVKDCLYSAYGEIKSRKGETINGVFIKDGDLKNAEQVLNKTIIPGKVK